MNEYETFKSTSTKSFDYQIWSSFENGKSVQHMLIENHPLEYTKLKDYSKDLLSERFNNIETKFHIIKKTTNGYDIYRCNSRNKYIIILNINDNQIEIKRSI